MYQQMSRRQRQREVYLATGEAADWNNHLDGCVGRLLDLAEECIVGSSQVVERRSLLCPDVVCGELVRLLIDAQKIQRQARAKAD